MRRLLIVGCGDVALRAMPYLQDRFRVFALTHSPERIAQLRARGIEPIPGDLDQAASLHRVAGIAHDVLHCAPPPGRGNRDSRTTHLIAALSKGKSLPRRLVYISTSGVYGDCGGAMIDETRRVNPQSSRARRRVDAEQQLRGWGRRNRVSVSVLRAPGIYAEDRLPLARLREGMPALRAEDDCYTNHVHADDLARLLVAAMRYGAACRMYNASDDSRIKSGDYFDIVADQFGLPRPPRISRGDAADRLSPVSLSFLSESRLLVNQRIKRELRFVFRYPTVAAGVARVAARRVGS